MATINCPTTLECPALPRVTLSQAVIDLMESIALQVGGEFGCLEITADAI